jgi:hypothetical protein
MLRLVQLWPGFYRCWFVGDPAALVLAILFAILLNTSLLCSLVWTEIVSPEVRILLWIGTVGGCTISAAASRIQHRLSVKRKAVAQDLFLAAQREYLRGEFKQAELVLLQVLRQDPADVSAHLMLATLFRRQKRFEEAERQLRTLRRLEESQQWSMEIEAEQILLSRRGGRSTLGASSTRERNFACPIDRRPIDRRDAA